MHTILIKVILPSKLFHIYTASIAAADCFHKETSMYITVDMYQS